MADIVDDMGHILKANGISNVEFLIIKDMSTNISDEVAKLIRRKANLAPDHLAFYVLVAALYRVNLDAATALTVVLKKEKYDGG